MPDASGDNDHVRRLLTTASFELVPIGSFDRAVSELPANSRVTITCSPARGVDATLDSCERAVAHGHRVVPHIASRMVTDLRDVRRIAARLEAMNIDEVFVIAGDSTQPQGRYVDTVGFLTDLLDASAGRLRRVGVAAYPDGHPFIDRHALGELLLAKQQLLAAASVDGYATTQICFDAGVVRRWLEQSRATGLDLPIDLGMAGALDPLKLLRFGIQIGVGSSLRYLRKNTSTRRLLAPARYDPAQLLEPLVPSLAELGVDGLHLNTFNQVAASVKWRDEYRTDGKRAP
jgi:methylenetetrahydrofolate reductase (NADH)